MTFSSLAFLFIFFPIVFILYSICKNNLVRNILLIFASLIFYAFGEPVAVFIMLISIGLNYFFGLLCGGVIGRKSKNESVCEVAEEINEEFEGANVAESVEEVEDGTVTEPGESDAELEDESEDGDKPEPEESDAELEDESEDGDKPEPEESDAELEDESEKESDAENAEGTEVSEALRKVGLIAAIVLNIGLLFAFKYVDFFLDSVGLGRLRMNIALPIGISFFTFQGLSYVIDVYRDRECVQRNPLLVTLYISFFPQLIAGPIVKYHDISKQLVNREFNIDRIGSGLQRFIFGLGKKVLIAGPMGLMVDSVYGLDISGIGAASAWIAAISYIFQIYFDFSGYSDMAIGLGCIFGFDFKENFDNPYTAVNMQHFWRKWHISLSTWFKEYVYIPLGGNRKGYIRTYLNKFIVFTLTGLWHGANWTFVCWGLMHGLALIAEDLIKRLFKKDDENVSEVNRKSGFVSFLRNAAGHIYTMIFVTLTFIVFRADSMGDALRMIGRLFSTAGANSIAFSLMTPTYVIALVAAVILSFSVLGFTYGKIKEWVKRILSVIIYILSLCMLITGGYNPFIYFRF